jgi:predicted ATPase/class 3 adenylate cyclase
MLFPTGTVTFLFTDIEGSTKLAQEYPDVLPALLARHREILQQAIQGQNGYLFQIVGDSFSAAFHSAIDALNAALDAQRKLYTESWTPAPIKVRMGIHTGVAQLADDPTIEGPYSGYATLALTQRIMSAGHGGQILLSQSTFDLTRDRLPENVELSEMGERHLKDVLRPEHLYQLTVPDLPSAFPSLNTLESFHHNLPIQLTSFVGREKEIAEIKAMLNSARLVTLTGSGGTGKTRLSIEVGTELLLAFSNGVWLIELAPLADPAQIIPALAQAFGLQELPFRPLASQVMDYLRDKKLLLILDNCEHLIAACARLADDLLHQCTGLKVLASSREALGIAGGMAYRTPSLADSESIRLFVERAHAANARFSLTDSNVSSVTQICSRLDGIPLAIELAAARTKLLSADQIAARLDDLFRLLVGGSRTALPRQQTLRALIDWSYDLLSEEEKQLLWNASIFMGGWTLDALEAVSEDPNAIEHLEQLINKSLVVTEERDNEMRYFMLETIRQYAREKLFDAKQASVARDRHFVYFDDYSEKIWDATRSAEILVWRDKADQEMENMRAALEWGLDHHAEEAVHLAANICVIAGWMGNQTDALAEVKLALGRIRSLPPAEGEANIMRQKIMAKALFVEGMTGMSGGNIPAALESLREAISLARRTGDKRMLGYSLEMFYTASTFEHPLAQADAAEEGFSILSEIDDPWGLGIATMNMARIASARGDVNAAQKFFGKLKERLQDASVSFQAGMGYLGMGYDERSKGNPEIAKGHFEEGLKIFKQLRFRTFETVMKSELGHIARVTGDFAGAKEIYKKTIAAFQDLGNRSATAHQLECFAFLAIIDEEPPRAARLFGAAEALREKINVPMMSQERVEYDQAMAQLHAMLTAMEFTTLWAEGRSMTMEQAIELALGDS